MNAEQTRRALARFLTEKPYLRFALLVTVAVGVSSWLSTYSEHVSATIAAVTAATVIQPTLHHSLREVFWQIVGVGLGIMVALAAAATIGFTPVALAGAVFAVFLFCRLFNLSAESAIGVVVPTILIIAGNAFTVEAVEARIAGVLLGGTVGVALSFLVRPGTPTLRTLRKAEQESLRAADIVTQIAEALDAGQISATDAQQWVETITDVGLRLADIRVDAEDAVRGSRWSPMLRRDEAESVLLQVQIAQDTARTVAGIVDNAVLLAAGSGHSTTPPVNGGIAPLPEPVAAALSEVLTGTAEMIEEQAVAAATVGPAVKLPDDAEQVQHVQHARHRSTKRVKETDETGPLLLGGALLRDSQTLETILTAPTCANSDSGEPDRPERGSR